MKYLEYEAETERLYKRTADFGKGRCIEVTGLPGAGLRLFVNNFIEKYSAELEERKIYCCVVRCPLDHPKYLYLNIMKEISEIIDRLSTHPDIACMKEELEELKEYRSELCSLYQSNETTYHEFEDRISAGLNLFHKFQEKINIRLIITNFDNARNIFNKDVNYAMLFKAMCENHNAWLGVTITSHRTLAVIASIVEVFSQFALLFNHQILLRGFDERQLQQVFEQMRLEFSLEVSDQNREKMLHYCGNNPQRLSIMYTALQDLHADLEGEEWECAQGDLIDRALAICGNQMEVQSMRILRTVQDIQGNGMKALQEVLKNTEACHFNSARNYLFDMQILVNREEDVGNHAVLTIPVLEDVIKGMENTNKDVIDKQELNILHLSDLHFGSDNNEDEQEVRKTYISNFMGYMKKICLETEIDYILITGDIGWEAQEKDYKEAEHFIRQLLDLCKMGGEKLFLCPGNHDVDREKINEISYPENQTSADKLLSLQKLEKRSEAFCNYIMLCERLGCRPYSVGKHSSYLIGAQRSDDFIVACLNTSWLAKDKEYSKKVWVGKNYVMAIKNTLEEMGEENKLPVITLMHHPVKAWEEEESASYRSTVNVWGMVSQMSNLILCGHTHETDDIKNIVNDARVFGGGVFYQGYSYQNSFYIYKLQNNSWSKTQHQFMSGKWVAISE